MDYGFLSGYDFIKFMQIVLEQLIIHEYYAVSLIFWCYI